MRGRGRGRAPIVVGGTIALAALLGVAWLLGLWPSLGGARVESPPSGATPAWVSRLGLSDLTPGSSPNPLVEDRIAALEGTASGDTLRRDLCGASAMDPDPAFRRVRQALLINNAGICPSPIDQMRAKAPLAVAFGPAAGWPITLGLVAALATLGVGGLLAVKRRYDRWRLLGRSTFGRARGAGSG